MRPRTFFRAALEVIGFTGFLDFSEVFALALGLARDLVLVMLTCEDL